MSESEEEELDEFERQLKFEQEEKERRSKCSNIVHGSTRTDPDGTVYEWDADKMAYFPKIDADFIAQYQMNYGEYTVKTNDPSSDKAAATSTPPISMSTTSDSDWTQYFQYAQKYIADHGDYPPGMSQVHKDYYVSYYNYYYGNKDKTADPEKSKENTEESKKEENKEKGSSEEKEMEQEGEDEGEKKEESGEKDESSEKKEETPEEKAHREYYEYYGQYYSKQAASGEGGDKEQAEYDEWAWYNYYYGSTEEGAEAGEKTDGDDKEGEKKEGDDKKKAKKKKAEEGSASWFEMDQSRTTNVYVSGLPDDITDEEYEALMAKCGMISLDPRNRRLKLKLYRNAEGKPKGDGLCCYIKPESVDLALQVLDEYDVRGHKISVEKAKFELKGTFDPKKRKKLSNREKKKIRKHQEKLLDWRPDKPKGYRAKHERILVIKNGFDPAEFEGNPAKIQMLREELRAQCINFGTVKKIIIYDRHPEGVITVGFDEVEEADQGKESLHGRYFKGRQIQVEAWDGKTKFDVQETEEEKQARLKQWANFLETGGETESVKSDVTPKTGRPTDKDEKTEQLSEPSNASNETVSDKDPEKKMEPVETNDEENVKRDKKDDDTSEPMDTEVNTGITN